MYSKEKKINENTNTKQLNKNPKYRQVMTLTLIVVK